MKKHRFSVCFGILLTAFTAFVALQTFVFSEVYQTGATQMNLDLFAAETSEAATQDNLETREEAAAETSETATQDNPETAAQTADNRHKKSRFKGQADDAADSEGGESIETGITDNTYEDENIAITIEEYEVYNTHVYVADIRLSSAEYLKSAFAQDTYGKNVTAVTSAIAEDHASILAVNGDNYGSRESGYVIRNGIVYRSSGNGEDVLCIYADGTMEIVDSDQYTAEELAAAGVWQAFCFGPGLLDDGEILVSAGDEVGKSKASNPRTAIGMIDSLHYVLVVSDGRTNESEGLSLLQLASFMQDLGVACAYNLDGGGSSTMVFQGQVVNNPTTNGTIKERKVNDIVYIG